MRSRFCTRAGFTLNLGVSDGVQPDPLVPPLPPLQCCLCQDGEHDSEVPTGGFGDFPLPFGAEPDPNDWPVPGE